MDQYDWRFFSPAEWISFPENIKESAFTIFNFAKQLS